MKRIALSSALFTLVLASAAAAQDTPPPIIFGQYTRCNVGQESRADEIVRTVWGPVAQKHVDSGQLTSWGYLAHVQGGSWRRILVVRGTDIDKMMDARSQITEEAQSQNPKAMTELGTICPGHDDYIWAGVVGAPETAGTAAAPASISTYYVCDNGREGRANEIFEQLMAPLYKKQTDMGQLTGWGFYAHRMGGQFRRLETFSGADHKTLLKVQNAIYQEAQQLDPLAFNEFRQICNSHTDYMWSDAKQAAAR